MHPHGGDLWVTMWVVGPNNIVRHGKEARRDTDGPCGNELGVLLMQNT